MKKKVLGLCLILLISVVLIVSCSPDPIKKNKAIGTWELLFEDYETETPGVYVDLLYTLKITEGSFTLEIAVVDADEPIGTAKGTWTAKTTTDGELTVTEASEFVAPVFPVDSKASFAASDKNLFVEVPDGEGEAMVFTKK